MKFTQIEAVGRPIINVTVWGDNLEDFDEAIAFEVNNCASCSNGDLVQGSIAGIVRIDVPIALESGQPNPIIPPNQLEVIEAAVPAIMPSVHWDCNQCGWVDDSV